MGIYGVFIDLIHSETNLNYRLGYFLLIVLLATGYGTRNNNII